jgi:hypothetical protein
LKQPTPWVGRGKKVFLAPNLYRTIQSTGIGYNISPLYRYISRKFYRQNYHNHKWWFITLVSAEVPLLFSMDSCSSTFSQIKCPSHIRSSRIDFTRNAGFSQGLCFAGIYQGVKKHLTHIA